MINNVTRVFRAFFYICVLFVFVVACHTQSPPSDYMVETDTPAFKELFKDHFTFGCILSYPHIGFEDDPPVPGQGSIVAPNGGVLVLHHMNSMTPGNNMKPENTVDIAASAAAYDTAADDEGRRTASLNPHVRFNGNMIAQLNWAKRNGFVFRGHTLVWHNQTPDNFFREGYSANGAYLSREDMTERMRNYIGEVVRLLHEGWPGMVVAMDVVNEAVSDNGTNRIQNNTWYTVFGDMSYVKLAFRFAREFSVKYNETQMKLYYNDYNTHVAVKADGIVRLVSPVFEAGYLDGIGMQHHDSLYSPSESQLVASYNKFKDVCSEITVTELDVDPRMSSSPSEKILEDQARQYAMLFRVFLERSYGSGRGIIVNVTKDGLNDRWAFRKYASLWDEGNKVKPAFWAVAETAGSGTE